MSSTSPLSACSDPSPASASAAPTEPHTFASLSTPPSSPFVMSSQVDSPAVTYIRTMAPIAEPGPMGRVGSRGSMSSLQMTRSLTNLPPRVSSISEKSPYERQYTGKNQGYSSPVISRGGSSPSIHSVNAEKRRPPQMPLPDITSSPEDDFLDTSIQSFKTLDYSQSASSFVWSPSTEDGASEPDSILLDDEASHSSGSVINGILENLSPCGPDGCTETPKTDQPYFRSSSAVPDYVKETSTKLERPTLNDLLKPHCPPMAEVQREYQGFSNIMCWFNGSPDKSLPTFALWPPTIRTYHIITPRLLQTPAVDLGYSKVTARLRRAVLLISSLQYRCYYCAAHTAATGDMLHGSWRSQVRSSSRESDYRPIVDPFDSRLSEYESEALFLATAASAIPSKVTPDLKRRVRAHFKGEEYEQIACITAFIAWTNAITDSVGMELEAAALLWAEEQISDAGWEGRRHAPETYDPASLKSRIELKREAETQETTPHRGFGRVMDLLRLLRSTQGANSAEAAWLKGFPSGHTQLNKWLKYTLGFVPEYLGNMTNKESKRAVCFALWQFLLRPKNHVDPCVTANGVSEWSHGAKVLLWYVYTTKTGNLLLQGHAAFLAQQMRVPHHILSIAAAGGCIGDPRVDIALDFIRTSASLKRTYTGQLSLKLFESVASPAGVMELVSSLGLFNMLHRLSAILAPDPPRFEPEVKYFLSTVGAGLGLDPSKAGPQRDQDAENPLQFLL